MCYNIVTIFRKNMYEIESFQWALCGTSYFVTFLTPIVKELSERMSKPHLQDSSASLTTVTDQRLP